MSWWCVSVEWSERRRFNAALGTSETMHGVRKRGSYWLSASMLCHTKKKKKYQLKSHKKNRTTRGMMRSRGDVTKEK